MEECIFCKIIKRAEPAYILDENEDILVFLSLENHPLVVPKKHMPRSEEHTSELQSQSNLVCRLLLEKKKSFRLPDAGPRYGSARRHSRVTPREEEELRSTRTPGRRAERNLSREATAPAKAVREPVTL